MFKPSVLKEKSLIKSLSLFNRLRDWTLIHLWPKFTKMIPTTLWPEDPPLLGLAINAQEIQLLWVEARHTTCKVLYYARCPMPVGVIVDRKIKSPEKITEALQTLLAASACKIKQVAIALPNIHVITKQISLPHDMSEFELASDIEFEAARNLSMSMENVSLDYHVLAPSQDTPEQMNVLLIASLSAPIQERLQMIEAAGLEVKVVDVESYVLQRSVQFCLAQFSEGVPQEWVVLFDLNGDMLNFIALHQGELVYHQADVFISDEFTRIVVEKYQLSPSITTYTGWASLVPANYWVELFPLVQALLLKQMVHCFQLFASSLFFNKIDYVFISGNIAQVPGIEEWLSKELKISSVGIANPLKNAHFSDRVNQTQLRQQAHQLMGVMGLALRGKH